MHGADGLANAGFLSFVRWETVFAQIFREPLYGSLIGSGLLVTLGLLGRYLKLTWSVHGGVRPDFYAPLLRLMLFALVLANYQRICLLLMHAVQALAEGPMLRGYDMDTVWQNRHDAYQRHVHLATDRSVFMWLAPVTFINGALELMAHLCLAVSQATIVGMRTLQVFFLMLLFVAGPWMLALAFLGGPFRGLGWSWLLGIVEVTSWSFGLRVLAFSFQKIMDVTVAQDYTFSREIAITTSMAMLVPLVPVVMARLWRGQATGEAASGALLLAQNMRQSLVRR